MSFQKGRNIKYNTIKREEKYWIDRQGKLRKYQGDLSETIISMHYEIAVQEFPKIPNVNTDHLFYLGWIMIGSSCYSQPIIHKKPSQKQLDVLYDLNLLKRLGILMKEFYEPWEKVKHEF